MRQEALHIEKVSAIDGLLTNLNGRSVIEKMSMVPLILMES